MQMCRVNNIVLNRQILVNKLSRVRIVSNDPADFRGRKVNLINMVSRKKTPRRLVYLTG